MRTRMYIPGLKIQQRITSYAVYLDEFVLINLNTTQTTTV